MLITRKMDEFIYIMILFEQLLLIWDEVLSKLIDDEDSNSKKSSQIGTTMANVATILSENLLIRVKYYS